MMPRNEKRSRFLLRDSLDQPVPAACDKRLEQFWNTRVRTLAPRLSQLEKFVPFVMSDSSRRRVFLVLLLLTSRSYRAQRFWFVSNRKKASSLRRKRVNTF